jgi:transposase InsO family protein
VERSHRIDSEEFYRLLEGKVIDDANLFAERLQQWEDHYNYDRPHRGARRTDPLRAPQAKTENPLS